MKHENFTRLMHDIFEEKSRLYGKGNVAIDSVLARMRDKLARLDHMFSRGCDISTREGVLDACVDLSNYAFILNALHDGSWHADDDTTVDRTVAHVVGDINPPAKPGDVGFDLRALTDLTLEPLTVTSISTGVRVLAPKDVWYRIAGRSSMTMRGIIVLDNVIDTEYTGELRPVVYNIGTEAVRIAAGDRVAQVVFFHSVTPDIIRIEEMPKTARGDAGYGSTGR